VDFVFLVAGVVEQKGDWGRRALAARVERAVQFDFVHGFEGGAFDFVFGGGRRWDG
jgi:hypothetical protein